MKYVLYLWLLVLLACSSEPTPQPTAVPQPKTAAVATAPAPVSPPSSASLPASKPSSVPVLDMSTFDTSCKKASDCVMVQPSRCGRCGCANMPLAKKELKRFQKEIGAIECPPLAPMPPGAGCGGCSNYEASCKKGKCVADR